MSAVLLIPVLLAASPPAAEARPAVTVGEPVELLKLPKTELPPVGLTRAVVRLSPDGERMLYIRAHGPGKAKLHVRQVGQPRSDQSAVWDEPIPAFYCGMSFAGRAWRADGQRVLFCQEPARDEDGWAEGVFGRRMRPWHMCWDLPNPQYKLCRHVGVRDAPGCTSLSYSPRGDVLWTAFSDTEGHKTCGVTGWPAGERRGFTAYRGTGADIYHLAPSPDGTHLAWVETYPREKGRPLQGPDVVVFRIQPRKVVLRVGLSREIPGWLDAQAPVWAANSRGVCFGDVVEVDRIWRREVKVTDLTGRGEKLLARDALAVGACAEGFVLNRGPACAPMRQLISSHAPVGGGADRPAGDDVILCDPARAGKWVTLVPSAFAQQVCGRRVVYARASGDDVLILAAALKRGS